jgi:N5-(cytidine 5'-diphosphoramidyl)-L-glutamine hydrolase
MNGAPQKPTNLVAVSQRVDVIEGRNERRDAIDQRLAEYLSAANLVPVPVPNQLINTPAGLQPWLSAFQFIGVILSGGNNIGEVPERDSTESVLLDFARDHDIPVLGICRGMQIMTIWSGGSLKPVEGHVRTRHSLSGEITANVNSYHDLALSDCPAGFEVTARSEDGEIEAISHTQHKWQGWMWHPEREPDFALHDIERLTELFSV